MSVGPTKPTKEEAKARFEFEYRDHELGLKKIEALKSRTPLPPDRMVVYEPGCLVLWAKYQTTDPYTKMGDLDYKIGPLANSYVTGTLEQSTPQLVTRLPGTTHPPAFFIIAGFHSKFENTVKGIGGALLCEAAKIAEAQGCPFIVVITSSNDPVYEAFGFKQADTPGLGTLYTTTAALKVRTKGYETPTTTSNFPTK